MNTKVFNIYLIGVGGQGLGLLSEVIARAAILAGFKVSGTDTHGLAQRGGMVDSTIRIGQKIWSPLIRKGDADLVIGMEINETLRGINEYLKKNGKTVFYNVSLQPLPVRLKKEKEVKEIQLKEACNDKEGELFSVKSENIEDSRMQNIALLGVIAKNKLIPGITAQQYEIAMTELMNPKLIEANLKVFREI